MAEQTAFLVVVGAAQKLFAVALAFPVVYLAPDKYGVAPRAIGRSTGRKSGSRRFRLRLGCVRQSQVDLKLPVKVSQELYALCYTLLAEVNQ